MTVLAAPVQGGSETSGSSHSVQLRRGDLEVLTSDWAPGWRLREFAGSALGVRVVADSPRPIERSAEGAVWREADGERRTIRLRVHASGVEDFIRFQQRPSAPSVRYEVELAGLRGLRQVGTGLEFLDEAGNVRWRMSQPILIAADGSRTFADVHVSGCRVDRDPSPPWRRRPTAAGASRCELQVRWHDAGVLYPAVLDPKWTLTTAALQRKRDSFTATALPSGEVLLVGGLECGNFIKIADAEIFAPAGVAGCSASQGCVAAAAPPAYWFRRHQAHLIAQGVLISGGAWSVQASKNIAASQVFDPASYTWLPPVAMNDLRLRHAGTVLADGSVLVSGGSTAGISAERFDGTTWTPKNTGLTLRRESHSLTTVGTLAVAVGGADCATNPCKVQSAIEYYDAQTGAWATVPNLSLPPRWGHSAIPLSGDRVLLVGGSPCLGGTTSCASYSTAQMLDTKAWTLAAAGTHAARALHGAAPLAGGNWIFAGGNALTDAPAIKTSDVFDLETETFSAGPDLVAGRMQLALAPLPGGSAAAFGGLQGVFQQCDPTVEVLTQLSQGDPCQLGAECASGFCVDGVCCAEACNQTCRACSAATKADASSDGTCGLAKVGTDPHGDCAATPNTECKTTGECAADGSCALWPTGTSCGKPNCSGTGQALQVPACTGSGTCAVTLQDCSPFQCGSSSCGQSCVSTSDCASSAFCAAGVCQPRKQNGLGCQTADECASLFCTDGVCCDGPCSGQCEACNVTGTEGACVPVSGAPVPPRGACEKEGTSACSQRACNGAFRTACAGYVGASQTCSAGSCSDGVAVTPGVCNGQGSCSSQTLSCAPYSCSGDACASTCLDDLDCLAPARCNQGQGTCVVAAKCSDDTTLERADGSSESCIPFRCEGSACRTTCDSVADCAGGAVCSASRRCESPSGADQEGGCGCKAPGRAPVSGWWVLGAFAALMSLRRRR